MSRSLDVIIVGAGLAGLHAARLLEAAGVTRYAVLEGRPRIGGRIHSFEPALQGRVGGEGGFDLGATWLWPGFQRELMLLVQQLGLPTAPQEGAGDMLFERTAHEPVARFAGMAAMPPSFRIVGGMGQLLNAVGAAVPAERIHLETRVVQICVEADGVVVTTIRNGVPVTWRAPSVLLALPPRLAVATLVFDPPLPADAQHGWQSTGTHMAAHAKYLAVYPSNFWRDRGLSGEARSLVGPLGEIHDASSGSHAALFGFFALSAAQRAGIPDEELKHRCRSQLARLFGDAAREPLADAVQDWSAESFTATPACAAQTAGHGCIPDLSPGGTPWGGRLFGAGSEWSPSNPGYLAGAIEASTRAVQAFLSLTHSRVQP